MLYIYVSVFQRLEDKMKYHVYITYDIEFCLFTKREFFIFIPFEIEYCLFTKIEFVYLFLLK